MKLQDKILELLSEDENILDTYPNYKKEKKSLLLEESKKLLKKSDIDNFNDTNLNHLDNHPEKYHLAKTLISIKPEILIKNFGENAILWAINNYGIDDENLRLMNQKYCEYKGISEQKFEMARHGIWRKCLNTNTLNIKRAIKLIKSSTDQLININLEELLINNSDISFKKENIKKYSLEKTLIAELYTLGGGHSEKYQKPWKEDLEKGENTIQIIQMETPIGFLLKYENKPAAVISILPYYDNSLAIYQMQGTKEVILNDKIQLIKTLPPRGLGNINWKKIFVELNENISKNLGFENSCIISAQNNMWTKELDKNNNVHLPMKRAIQIYDNTAKSLNYTRSKDNNYYKKLS